MEMATRGDFEWEMNGEDLVENSRGIQRFRLIEDPWMKSNGRIEVELAQMKGRSRLKVSEGSRSMARMERVESHTTTRMNDPGLK